MKTALIIGASSGIGRALAKVLSRRGYRVGVVARCGELLATLQAELPAPSISRLIDGADAHRLQRRSTISNTISRMP